MDGYDAGGTRNTKNAAGFALVAFVSTKQCRSVWFHWKMHCRRCTNFQAAELPSTTIIFRREGPRQSAQIRKVSYEPHGSIGQFRQMPWRSWFMVLVLPVGSGSKQGSPSCPSQQATQAEKKLLSCIFDFEVRRGLVMFLGPTE
jgi:hypothetical protein